jgi:hypothetical protein
MSGRPPVPPDNGSYLVAAYILSGVIYLGYAVSLVMRARGERRGK